MKLSALKGGASRQGNHIILPLDRLEAVKGRSGQRRQR